MVGLTECCKCGFAVRRNNYERSAPDFQTVKSIGQAGAASPNPIDFYG
jgi:Zn ribbon nucleic-acid-binding protein